MKNHLYHCIFLFFRRYFYHISTKRFWAKKKSFFYEFLGTLIFFLGFCKPLMLLKNRNRGSFHIIEHAQCTQKMPHFATGLLLPGKIVRLDYFISRQNSIKAINKSIWYKILTEIHLPPHPPINFSAWNRWFIHRILLNTLLDWMFKYCKLCRKHHFKVHRFIS